MLRYICKKYISLAMAFVMALSLVACGSSSEEAEQSWVVFTFAGEEVLLSEVYIYARTIMDEYEATYGAEVWGTTIESEDGLAMDVNELARQEIIETIIRTKVLVACADDYGLALTLEEETEQQETAVAFFENLTDEQIADVDMTEDVVATVLVENALASKVYDYIMNDDSLDVSDEQARMTTFYDMYFECYYEDEYGNIVVYNADKIAEQKAKVESVYATIKEELAENPDLNITFFAYTYDLAYAGSHTMSQAEIAETYGQEVLTTLYAMKDGDISKIVETEYGYHIFQMTSLTDAEATAEYKAELAEQARESYYVEFLETKTEELDSSYSYSSSVDQEVYGIISFE